MLENDGDGLRSGVSPVRASVVRQKYSKLRDSTSARNGSLRYAPFVTVCGEGASWCRTTVGATHPAAATAAASTTPRIRQADPYSPRQATVGRVRMRPTFTTNRYDARYQPVTSERLPRLRIPSASECRHFSGTEVPNPRRGNPKYAPSGHRRALHDAKPADQIGPPEMPIADLPAVLHQLLHPRRTARLAFACRRSRLRAIVVLLFFRGSRRRARRCLATAQRLQHLIEIPGAGCTLMLGRRV